MYNWQLQILEARRACACVLAFPGGLVLSLYRLSVREYARSLEVPFLPRSEDFWQTIHHFCPGF